MALSLRENRKKKKYLYKSDTHFSSGNHPFEVGDVNFPMLKWLPNVLLTLHKLCIGVVYHHHHHLPPSLVCVCVCVHAWCLHILNIMPCSLSVLTTLFLPVKWHHVRNYFFSDATQKQGDTLSCNPNAYLNLESLYSKWAAPSIKHDYIFCLLCSAIFLQQYWCYCSITKGCIATDFNASAVIWPECVLCAVICSATWFTT